MIVIGLTGGIGSGKSEAARVLSDLGALVIDADRLGHEVYAKGTLGFESVTGAFGSGIVGSDGEIDRRKLGQVVFSDETKRRALEAIVWPLISASIEARLAQAAKDGAKVAVIEAAVLFEAGWDRLVDVIWVVEAPVEVVVDRLTKSKRWSEEEIRRRIAAQAQPGERRGRATLTILNGGDIEQFKKKVRDAWGPLARRAERG